jgi:outer membrane protein assembly factor BamB
MPGGAGVWGYIACEDGILYGSRSNEKYVVPYLYGRSNMKHILTESVELFAIDVKTGKHKWSHKTKHSLRHNAIVIGKGKVYFIDSPIKSGKESKTKNTTSPTAILLCLDAAKGKVIWQNSQDIYGTTLALSIKHKVLVMGYQYSQRRFQLCSERGDRLTGFNVSDGKRLWDVPGRYFSRPLINDRTVYTQPYALDLLTGKKTDFRLKGRGNQGCGNISGSTNLLLYRDGVLGYTDLTRNVGTENYGPIRPGCWINAIVGGGLVLVPDASDGCTCSYLIKASIALQP